MKIKSVFGKTLILILCLVLAFGLMACGDSGDQGETPEPSAPTEPDQPEEDPVEISVDPGLTDIEEADWGVCFSGESVKYDLGMQVAEEWPMEGSIRQLEGNVLDIEPDKFNTMLIDPVREAELTEFMLNTTFTKLEMSPEEAKIEGIHEGDVLKCTAFKENKSEEAFLEIGAYNDPAEDEYYYFTAVESGKYTLASQVNIEEICSTLKRAYGIEIDPERLEKGIKETFDRAAYYIVPEGGAPAELPELGEEDLGAGGLYSCSVEQTATAKTKAYTDNIALRISAEQVQIGEATLIIRFERIRNYAD